MRIGARKFVGEWVRDHVHPTGYGLPYDTTAAKRYASNCGTAAHMVGIDGAEIEKQLEELSLEIIAASPILADVTAELRTVRDALTSSVSDVLISPLPGRVEELARGVDVLLKPPSGSPLPMRLHGQGARSLAAVMVF